MNTQVARQNLPDNQAAWMENLQPIAPNLLRAVPASSPVLSTISSKTTTVQFLVNVGGIDYDLFFATDGSLTAVNANTGAQTSVAAPGTFSNAPDATMFDGSRILIMDATSGYATWDGILFVKKGGLSPNIHVTAGGTGYSSPPSISFSGGSGSGATATAVVLGGAVVAINLTNPGTGYLGGETITVNIGGPGTGATATVVVWPQITGTTITVGFGRVWYANGRVLGWTGTGAGTGQTWDDINPADAAGTLTIADADLQHTLTGLRFLNNYLYIFGDASIKQIGSITVQSSITLFTVLSLASDIGTTFLQTIQSYNRLVLFANKNGVYGIFGASVQKISNDMDGIFENVDFSLNMSSSLHDVHVFNVAGSPGGSIHCYILLVKYFDPLQNITRTLLLTYQSNKWFVVNVGNNLLSICGGVLSTTQQWETFVSSGSDVTPVLQNSNAPVQILLITSLTPHNNPIQAKQVLRSGIAVTTGIAQSLTMTVDTENGSNSYDYFAGTQITWLNNNGQVVQWLNNSQQPVNFFTGGFTMPDQDTDGYGKFVGNTVRGSVQAFAINMIANEYEDADPWGKSP